MRTINRKGAVAFSQRNVPDNIDYHHCEHEVEPDPRRVQSEPAKSIKKSCRQSGNLRVIRDDLILSVLALLRLNDEVAVKVVAGVHGLGRCGEV